MRFRRICLLALTTLVFTATASAALPSSPDAYLRQANGVRQSVDRPWDPAAGQLGNLRHVQITARDCAVRVVSGTENRVFPGSRDVFVVEGSRVLDADPDEQPAPRDVVLSTDRAQACPGVGSCGVSETVAKFAPHVAGAREVCFTLQLASAHDLLIGGDRLSLLIDRVRQPALRVSINPSDDLQVWFEDVDLGLLSIGANAAARVGGNGRVDFLGASSSNGASVMYLHAIDAKNIGISTTTTGTQWSIHIGADTNASYSQPARAPGRIAEQYPIEIDGPIERLDVPVGRVNPRPIRDATRLAARTLRDDVRARAGPAPTLPVSGTVLPSATATAAALPRDPRERVAQVVARYLPATVRITDVTLWKGGGRLEGVAADAATARDVARLLEASGEFTHLSGGAGAVPRDGGFRFSLQMFFSCDVPGEPSVCVAGDRRRPDRYSEIQVVATLEDILGPTITLNDARLDGQRITVAAAAPDEAAARAGLARIAEHTGLFRVSASGVGPQQGGSWSLTVHLELLCAVPPKPDGICPARDP